MSSSKLDILLDLVTDKTVSKQDRFYSAIVNSARLLKKFRFKDIYPVICKSLGATDKQASQGIAPCPYTGASKNIKGLIRSWVEERSPHSRQHYFRGGKRVTWTEKTPRPLLFINEKLGKTNAENEWMPYTFARGDIWTFNPDLAASVVKPTDDVLNLAAAAYKKQGMRGSKSRTPSTPDITVVTRTLNLAKPFHLAAAVLAH